jgi:PIN domain nuclease of toxin-antitoxin system
VKLLLDTHIWIWSVLTPRKISRKVATILGRSTNELWLSPISSYEVINLNRKGRFKTLPHPVAWIEEARRALPMRDALLTPEVALAAAEITLSHGNPLDTLLAATARAYGLTLVTADAALIAGKGFSILANE